ncbi:unnamed protein product [Choristocarpus tenellus]
MAHVPLRDGCVKVAVFCLSLMGTNLADFLREAHRVLQPGGVMKVAEVRSRFEGMEGGGVDLFLDVTRRLGFDKKQLDRSNKMFLVMEFKKSGRTPEQGVEFSAKVMNRAARAPCAFKKSIHMKAFVCARRIQTLRGMVCYMSCPVRSVLFLPSCTLS